MLKVIRLRVGPLEGNCYLVSEPENAHCAIIDPGAEPDRILHQLRTLKAHPRLIILTHGHIDHCAAALPLSEEYEIPVAIHRDDAELLQDTFLNGALLFDIHFEPFSPQLTFEEDHEFKLGDYTIRVLHTPGHTRGSVCLRADEYLFSGDTLFAGSVGRTDLPGGSWEELQGSLRRLMSLRGELRVLPGHGEATMMALELRQNPFLLQLQDSET